MGIIDRILSRAIENYIKAQGGASPPPFMEVTAENERFTVPDPSIATNQLELYQRLSWVADAVGYVSKFSAGVPLNVFKLVGEETEEIKNHDFETLVRKPNPTQSRYSFFEATYANLMLTGNAYWFLNKVAEESEPLELYTLPPNRIEVVPGGDVGIIAGYLWDAGKGEQIPLEEWEIVHFREYHPTNMWVGGSRVESVGKEANTEIAAAEYDMQFYGKDYAKPEGVLGVRGYVQDKQWEAFKRKFKRRHGGTKREMAMINGSEGIDYQQLALNFTDMDFINNRTFKKEQIYNHFAPGLAAILAVNATEANARTAKNTMLDMPLYGDDLIAEFQDVRQVERETELAEIAAYERTHTIDETRQKWYNEDGIGDERGELIPSQIGTINVSLDEPEDEEEPAEMPPQFIEQQPEPPPEPEDEEEENKALKAIADIEHLFKAEVQDLIDGALNGALDRRTFTSRLRSTIARFAKSAYREGLITGGVESGELSEDDNQIIITFIREQQAHAKNLAEQIYSDNITELQAGQKSTIWYSKSIEPAFQKGLLSADANGMYEWQLGNTEEHCRDCLRLDGQRHRLKDWSKSGWLPRSDRLECNGFYCDCVLIPTRGKARGRLGKMEAHAHDEAAIELAAWKKFVKKRANRGELFADMKAFEVHHIDDETAAYIEDGLRAASNGDELKAVFRGNG
jgi:HK97 family phage portal protein